MSEDRRTTPPQCADGTAAAGSVIQDCKRALATGLTEPCGSGTEADAALVLDELMQLPTCVLRQLHDQGTTVQVGRGSVTDCRTDLRGETPRGWPPGSTWDNVPGLFSPAQNTVTVATRGHGTESGAGVPPTGDGHGSANLVLHEVGHAIDHQAGQPPARSCDASFNAARDQDLAGLSVYERQAGTAGQQETYAESLARYYGNDPDDPTDHPNLHAYWASDPICSDE